MSTRPRGRPPRTTEERAAHRVRLIEAVMAAVRDLGPDLSLDDMAAAAGVSKPVLYDEFGGRFGIADAIAVLLAERFERDTLAVWATTSELGFELVVGRSIEALIDLIESEPELYAFLVRSIRSGDRGFLDNALVRAINGRAIVVMGFLAPALDTDTIAVLTDGLFGFMFAAVESWLPRRRPSRSRFVAALAAVVSRGIQVAVDQAGAAVPGSRGRERGPERGQGRERERGQGRERGQRRGRLA